MRAAWFACFGLRAAAAFSLQLFWDVYPAAINTSAALIACMNNRSPSVEIDLYQYQCTAFLQYGVTVNSCVSGRSIVATVWTNPQPSKERLCATGSSPIFGFTVVNPAFTNSPCAPINHVKDGTIGYVRVPPRQETYTMACTSPSRLPSFTVSLYTSNNCSENSGPNFFTVVDYPTSGVCQHGALGTLPFTATPMTRGNKSSITIYNPPNCTTAPLGPPIQLFMNDTCSPAMLGSTPISARGYEGVVYFSGSRPAGCGTLSSAALLGLFMAAWALLS